MINYYIDYTDYKPNEFLLLTLASWITHHKNNKLTIKINKSDDDLIRNFIKPFINYVKIIHTFPPEDFVTFPSFAIVLNNFADSSVYSPTFFKSYDIFFTTIYENNEQLEQDIDIPTDAILISFSLHDYFPLLWERKTILGYYWNLYVKPFLENIEPFDSFSFCLYGGNPKYCEGMIVNIQLAKELFPDFHIILYVRNVPQEYINKIIELGGDKLHLYYIYNFKCMMLYRLMTINHYQVKSVFSRDADSRLSLRDKDCIKTFLENTSCKNYQVIRDHYYHKSKIMGGTFGWKDDKTARPHMFSLFRIWMKKYSKTFETLQEWSTDEKFLEEYFYTEYYNKLFIQTNIVAYKNEITYPIFTSVNNEHEFIGNTWDIQNNISIPVFSYKNFPLESHVQWLVNENQWEILCRMKIDGFYDWNFLKNFQCGSNGLYGLKNIIEYFFKAQIQSISPDSCSIARKLLGYFHNSVCMDENTYKNSNALFAKSAKEEGMRFIATTDLNRMPTDSSECVIIYGDYPYYAKNLWTDRIPNRIFRNVMFYNENLNVPVKWEYDMCWEPIQKIYVLNLEDARDRWIAVLGELAKMNAPLNRVYHYKAKRAQPRGDKLQIYSGATKNHCDCVKDFIESTGEYCLILEDDFMFCSDYENNKKTLTEFFKRKYEFDICMISYSKIGTTLEKDDMIYLSHQACTTSSGYILKKTTADKIYNILFEGYTLMLKTGDYSTFCCDRYWAKIQKDNGFFLLRDKLGYQRIIYSHITGLQNMYLD